MANYTHAIQFALKLILSESVTKSLCSVICTFLKREHKAHTFFKQGKLYDYCPRHFNAYGTVKTLKWHANHALAQKHVFHLKSTHCLLIVRLPDSTEVAELLLIASQA